MTAIKSSFSILLVLCCLVLFVNGDMMNNTIVLQNGLALNVIFNTNGNNISNFESGRQVVLLHGFPEGWYGWIDLMPQLMNFNNYSFVVPDLPGFNNSQSPDFSGFKMSNLVDDIFQLIQHTGQQVTLVGHDWGGIVAWSFASKYPQVLNGLVILNSPNPSVWWELIQSNPAQQNASNYIFFFESPDGFPELAANNFSLLASFFAEEPWFAPREQIYFDAWSKDLNNSLNYYRANIYGALGNWADMETDVPLNCTIDIPTLVLWGVNDPAFIPENYELLGKYVTNYQLHTFPNGTHWIHHDIPEILAPIIDDFITSITNQTSSSSAGSSSYYY